MNSSNSNRYDIFAMVGTWHFELGTWIHRTLSHTHHYTSKNHVKLTDWMAETQDPDFEFCDDQKYSSIRQGYFTVDVYFLKVLRGLWYASNFESRRLLYNSTGLWYVEASHGLVEGCMLLELVVTYFMLLVLCQQAVSDCV